MSRKQTPKEPPDPIPMPQAILDGAAACPHKYACLSAKTRHVCKVVDTTRISVFVKSDGRPCPFRHSFGVSHKLCTCPVRYELYARYGI